MESIRVTSETLAQYKADCRADYYRDRKERIAQDPEDFLKHDTSLVGRYVFIPKELITAHLTSKDLQAIAH